MERKNLLVTLIVEFDCCIDCCWDEEQQGGIQQNISIEGQHAVI